MVFPGKRSAGCVRCRQRRIKCDEGQPGCRKCRVHGQECPGYPSRFTFRPENERLAQQAAVRTQRKVARDRSSASRGPSGDLGTAMLTHPHHLHAQGSWPLLVTPSRIWDQDAINYFFHHHTASPTQVSAGHLDFLPDLYTRSCAIGSSCLPAATRATALASFAHHSKLPHLWIRAAEEYQGVLRAIRLSLSSSKASPNINDESLAAFMLLGLYEDISGTRNSLGNPHLLGVSTLLRGSKGAAALQDLNLSLQGWVFTQLHINAFLTMQWDETLSTLLSAAPVEEPTARAVPVVVKIGQFCQSTNGIFSAQMASASHSWNSSVDFKQSLLSLMLRAMQIQRDVDLWLASLPSDWRVKDDALHEDVESRHTAPKRIYNSQWLACFWILLDASLLIFYVRLDLCCQLLQQGPFDAASREARLALKTQGQVMTSIIAISARVCASIPTALGKFGENPRNQVDSEFSVIGGYLICWPLFFVMKSPYITTEQRTILEAALRQIRDETGLNMVTEALNQESRVSLFA